MDDATLAAIDDAARSCGERPTVRETLALVAEVRRLRAWSAQAAFNAERAGSDGDI